MNIKISDINKKIMNIEKYGLKPVTKLSIIKEPYANLVKNNGTIRNYNETKEFMKSLNLDPYTKEEYNKELSSLLENTNDRLSVNKEKSYQKEVKINSILNNMANTGADEKEINFVEKKLKSLSYNELNEAVKEIYDNAPYYEDVNEYGGYIGGITQSALDYFEGTLTNEDFYYMQ